jgi:hypothetical protein
MCVANVCAMVELTLLLCLAVGVKDTFTAQLDL